MYSHEIDTFLANEVVIQIESGTVLRNIFEMIRTASYLPKDEFFAKAVSAYMLVLDRVVQTDVDRVVSCASDTGIMI